MFESFMEVFGGCCGIVCAGILLLILIAALSR
jgi:hypothetical protein